MERTKKKNGPGSTVLLSRATLQASRLGKKPFEIPHEGGPSARSARQAIDDRIHKSQLEIQLLRRKRNELASISVLPSEMLAQIFVLVRDLSPDDEYFVKQAEWMCVSHVCHHWREVSLNHPSLWSVPVLTNPSLAPEMIRRSQMAALTLNSTVSTWAPRVLQQFESAMVQIFRIRSINLTLANHREKLKNIFSSFARSAPLLEKVTLCTNIVPFRFDTSTPADLLSFPSDAFADAPRLWSIALQYLNFSWESEAFKHCGVTTLRLTYLRSRGGFGGSFDHMMDALGHLSNLRVLELRNVIPSHTMSSWSRGPLDFKFLEQLILVDKAADCIPFLRNMQYPPCAEVQLNCSPAEIEDQSVILSLVGQRLQGPRGAFQASVIVRSLQLLSLSGGGARVAFFSEATRMKQHKYSFENLIVDILFNDGQRIGHRANGRLLDDVGKYFDLSSLKALAIRWKFALDEVHIIRRLLGKLPKLKFMEVFENVAEICLAIIENPDEIQAEEIEAHFPLSGVTSQNAFPSATVFCALESLLVNDVDLLREPYLKRMEMLIEMLMRRSDMNRPLNALIIDGGNGIWAPHDKILRELVVNLEVDGKDISLQGLAEGYDTD